MLDAGPATDLLDTASQPRLISAGPSFLKQSTLSSAARRKASPSIVARTSYMLRTYSGSNGATISPRPGASCSTPWLRSSRSACCSGWRETPSSCAICSWMMRSPGLELALRDLRDERVVDLDDELGRRSDDFHAISVAPT